MAKSKAPFFEETVDLLKSLIATPSFSKEEEKTAQLIDEFLHAQGLETTCMGHNVLCYGARWNKDKPTLLLNSHHDTVKPNPQYSRNPFEPTVENGKLFGLGSNDAGGALVSLIAAFLHLQDKALPFNLLLVASAEEEISGHGGIAATLEHLPPIDLAIVGEPTQMRMAIAEKGLMVLDGWVQGQAGHAARREGANAIYKALPDLQWFESYAFPKVSPALGPVLMQVTQIEAGQQHNAVPGSCHLVVDVRLNECYTHEEVLGLIRSNTIGEYKPRSTRLKPSGVPAEHPILKAAEQLGLATYGSPTLSDQALMPFTCMKMGPGKSARSHTADEFIYLEEIESGIVGYIALLEAYAKQI